MATYYTQKNITINKEQQEYLLKNHKKNNGRMSLSEISKSLKIGITKVHRNAELLGLVDKKSLPNPELTQGEELFDEKSFFDQYKY